MLDELVESLKSIAMTFVDIVDSVLDHVFGDDDDDNFPPMIPVATQ